LPANEVKLGLFTGVLLIGANALVCVVEKDLPSGLVAVFVGTMPMWILVTSWLFFKGDRPSATKLSGAIIACLGIAIIAWDSASLNLATTSWVGFAFLTMSCLLWTVGTLVQRTVPIQSPLRFSAVQMLAGSIAALLLSLAVEHPWNHDWTKVSPVSLWALAYLIVFGSLVAFTAYSWLTRNVPPHIVSTYAVVNPVIAVLLGSLFYQEPITPGFLTATLVIVVGLTLLLFRRRPQPSAAVKYAKA
jgi:drug/metabolite transporter (DMT)-like permease